MERRDLLYVLFWPLALAVLSYFLGFGEKALFLFSLSLVGAAFAERGATLAYAAGAVFLALAFAAYFGGSLIYVSQLFAASLLFLVLPSVLLEFRKFTSK